MSRYTVTWERRNGVQGKTTVFACDEEDAIDCFFGVSENSHIILYIEKEEN